MSDILKSVQNFYDEAGKHFSRTRQKTYGNGGSSNWPITDQYLSTLRPGQSVLDIGCGNGKLVSGLPEGVTYVGTDFSNTLLNEAKLLYPNHDFRYGDVVDPKHWEDLGQYDAIFCVAVLHHIPEREQQLYVLKQAKEHLKKDGFLYLSVWNLGQEKYGQYRVDDHFEIPYNKEWKRFCVSYDIQSMSNLLIDAGLDMQEIFYADHEGKKADVLTGQNLVLVAR
ncbi:class I SAM-dependent methyltransferase [Candidatus Woesebacteria bacterium]|nr:class I SAM-dependent methyltransferase [Candidatus Woesebacteria bacterium]